MAEPPSVCPLHNLARVPSGQRGRKARCPECAREKDRRKHARLMANPTRRLRRTERYRKYPTDPALAHKWRARQIAHNAIKSGKLVRQPCEVCGAVQVEAHHDDYAKPLSVRWLCRPHHREHHKLHGSPE
jgi:hypothetical protein